MANILKKLIYASWRGDYESVKSLLDAGAGVSGIAALAEAATNAQEDISTAAARSGS